VKSSVLVSGTGATETFADVANSDQLQINLVARTSYRFLDNYDIRVLAAAPLRNRDVNVDGLTRSITLSAGFSYLY